jgi:dihydroorotate dehydrogenase electron transfer subunit
MTDGAVFDGDVRLVANDQAAGVVTLTLESPNEFEGARAGQFALVASHRPGAPLLARPMSILGTTPLRIAFTVFGGGTQLLAEAEPGEALHLVGPLGRPFGALAENTLLVTDGTHFGTLLALAQERFAAERPVDAIFVTRPPDRPAGPVTAGEQDAVLAARFEASARSLRTLPLDRLEQALADTDPGAVAAGASNAAMAVVQRVFEERAIAGEAALQTAMPCGLGACQGCIFPVRSGGWVRVCEGPVFPLDAPAFAA